MKWYSRFLDLANLVASWSKDDPTKVGCVIADTDNKILSVGYNGFPKGINDDVKSRKERPQKYLWTEHAERNAIFTASSKGTKLEGSTMITTMFPCADCARAIIACGIKNVYSPAPKELGWEESHKVSLEMFNEAEVAVIFSND
jgi:dCMP deaminase